MKQTRPSGAVLLLRLVVATAVFCATSPAIASQRREPVASVEARYLSNAPGSLPGAWFTHTATAANITTNWTEIDHPLTNNNPNAMVHVTQNWNPGGVGNTYNAHPIGVWYRSSTNRWAIFNQDREAMPEGAGFNVGIVPSDLGAFVHTATSANIVSNWTHIDHLLANNNPDAMLLVTQNWNPGGASTMYNDHPIGVWYNRSASRWAVFNQDRDSMPEGASFNVLIVTTDSGAFVHTATAANISANWSYIDHPLANGNPNAMVHVTQNWNPGGAGGMYNDHPVGVWYHSAAQKWAVFNQDREAMPEGAAFNVVVAHTASAAFVQRATTANIAGNSTFIDHPLTNENRYAIVMASQNWNPDGVGDTYNNHPIGVWYSSGSRKWAVFNQDREAMPMNAAFNVLIPTVDTSVFVHIARAGNISSNYTIIEHPLTDNRPNAIVFVTPNWNPSGVGNTYNNHAIGVWYNSSVRKWSVFNQDRAAMPEGAAFNVAVRTDDANAFVHKATSGNTVLNYTLIDHPLTNRKPNAMLLVTQNWNPGGVGNTYNNHPIGVWYSRSAQKWSIFNQDRQGMPVNAAFNVLVIGYKVYLPIVRR